MSPSSNGGILRSEEGGLGSEDCKRCGTTSLDSDPQSPPQIRAPFPLLDSRSPQRRSCRIAREEPVPNEFPPGTQPGNVDLRVMGVVRADGLRSQEISARTLALICYLAFSKDGATAGELQHWLWGRGAPPRKRALSNAVHRARVALGSDSNGRLHLPRVTPSGAYRLSEGVTNDLDRFKNWISAAEGADSQEQAWMLRKGLSLVRGAPFSGGETGRFFAWADMFHRNHAEWQIDFAAHRLADLAMKFRDYGLARWGIQQGLLVTPGCEECYRRRFLVAHRTGRRSELQSSMWELKRVLADTEDPDGSSYDVSPGLWRLYMNMIDDS